MTSSPSPSAALQAANARLLALRAQAQTAARAKTAAATEQIATETAVSPAHEMQTTETNSPAPAPILPPKTTDPTLPALVAVLPPHLGWDSTAVSVHLRQRSMPTSSATASALSAIAPTPATASPTPSLTASAASATAPAPSATAPVPTLPAPQSQPIDTSDTQPPASPRPPTCSLHPDIALALLRQGKVAVGRLWLLLRWLDENGRGWLLRADMEAALTADDAPTRLCSPRYLRQLLAQGDGLFWEQNTAGIDGGRQVVWLRSQAKVAAGLGLARLHGRAVALPTHLLWQPIGEVRAHFYASFHSSRGEAASPIARDTLHDLSGASPRTQQTYEKRARVRVQGCVAIGAAVTASTDPQAHAWQHGRASFTWTDRHGQQGKPGRTYQARRLPNCYIGPHLCVGGKPRRLNHQLAVLRHQGDAGNDQQGNGRRRYHTNGAAAARAWSHTGGKSWMYWRGNGRAAGVLIWYELSPSL